MSFDTRTYLVANIALPLDASAEEAFSVSLGVLRRLGVDCSGADFKIYRKSVDARKKKDIKLIFTVAVSGQLPPLSSLGRSDGNVTELVKSTPEKVLGEEELRGEVVIVGTGPAGMFAALYLAELGFKPLLLERGGDVKARLRATELFREKRILDINSNIQFGAGGAGTFSDGKLVTRINDPLSSYVLEKLVEFGAPKEITYLARPHVGTDVLSVVVSNILSRITELGGRVLYNTALKDIRVDGRGVSVAITDKGEFKCALMLLAIGHSARDTYSMLMSRGVSFEAKQFSVGMRIEHLTSDIDKAMYGDFAEHPSLSHAEYNLSHNTKQRGVYTFCMCPGGIVVPAASEEGGVVTNGMSYHARDGKNSNSAVVCSVFKEDYGSDPRAAIEFQRKIERAAYISGGKDYTAPIITVGDFLTDSLKCEPSRILPSYMDGGVRLCSPKDYLPSFVCEGIKNALFDFDKKISGFAAKDAILTGAETRTSAPVRITREKESGLALGFDNLYPVGEGAGYAGGITSAAIDGLKAAINIAKRYKP